MTTDTPCPALCRAPTSCFVRCGRFKTWMAGTSPATGGFFGLSERLLQLDRGVAGVAEAGAAIGHIGGARGQLVQPEQPGRDVLALRDEARLQRILEEAVEVEPGKARAAMAEQPRDDLVKPALVIDVLGTRHDQIGREAG